MVTSGLLKSSAGWLFQGHVYFYKMQKTLWLYHVSISTHSKGENLEHKHKIYN